MVVVVAHHDVLVAIVPEERVRRHLHQPLRLLSVPVSRVLEPAKVVELNRDNRASLRVLDLEVGITK